MKLIRVISPLTMGDVTLQPNNSFILADGLVDTIRRRFPDIIDFEDDIDAIYGSRRYKGQDLSGKRILFIRHGGFGDILFMTPLIRRLKQLYPDSYIATACQGKYRLVFDFNPQVDTAFALPISKMILEDFDYYIHFEHTIEKDRNAEQMHAVDLFAKACNIDLGDDSRIPVYHLNEVAVRDVQNLFKYGLKIEPGKDKIASIQYRASAPVRTYPPRATNLLISMLAYSGWKVLILGSANNCNYGFNFKGAENSVFNLCGFPMEQSIAAVSMSDVVVSPDSAMTHFAAALRIKNVALYGPFPGKVRTKYYPLCTTLEMPGSCPENVMPCFTHSYDGDPPCGYPPQCLATIPPTEIIRAMGVETKLDIDLSRNILNIDLSENVPKLAKEGEGKQDGK